MKAAVMGVVQAHFRPEFINRLDEIVVFRAARQDADPRDRAHPDWRTWRSVSPSGS